MRSSTGRFRLLRTTRRACVGVALATVLLAGAVMLLVCLSLATLCILNLDLSRTFNAATAGRYLALAAVEQIESELDSYEAGQPKSPLEKPSSHFDLQARCKRPVFDRIPGGVAADVKISFDPADPHYSVDNLDSEVAAASWADRGTARKSIPPFCMDLMIDVSTGGQTHTFEAVVQRRWPYVLCTPGRVTAMGTPNPASLRNGMIMTTQPSVVKGPVYSLMNVDFDGAQPTLGSYQNPATAWSYSDGKVYPNVWDLPTKPEDTIIVSKPILESIIKCQPVDLAALTVGGEITCNFGNGKYQDAYKVRSEGNAVRGKVDLQFNGTDSAVVVGAGNEQDGGVRDRISPPNLTKNLQEAFKLPSSAGFKQLEQSNTTGLLPPGATLPDTDKPADTTGNTGSKDGGALNIQGTGTVGVVAPPAVKPPMVGGSPKFYYLDSDLVLPQGGTATSTNGAFTYDAGSRYLIQSSAGNRYYKLGADKLTGKSAWELFQSGAGVELNNCMLYVDGNLDLSASLPDDRGRRTVPTLRGTNATIIVNGTLVVTNGSLDGQDQGMVIYCKRLVSMAKGHYHGLMMVQKTAAFFPAEVGDSLEIRGAIICGGAPITIESDEAAAALASGGQISGARADGVYGSSSNWLEAGTVTLSGLHLWSTDLQYDAKYLKMLHHMGTMTTLYLKQIQ